MNKKLEESFIKYDKRTSWSIIYSRFEGAQARAVEFLNKELGMKITRNPSAYQLCLISCIKEGHDFEKNAIIVGKYNESNILQQYISSEEIKEDGYCLKVMESPNDKNYSWVLIAGDNDSAIFYGAVEFVDNYLVNQCPWLYENSFDFKLVPITISSAPKFKRRSLWTWSHTLNDFRSYVENAARACYNEIIMWSEYVPINIKEFIDYAHSFGIKIILGYSWGWQTGCGEIAYITTEYLKNLPFEIQKEYEENYSHLDIDGIYFQSFTEREDDNIGGVNIAEAVKNLVNKASSLILKDHPNLHIIFGLHATSVLNNLDIIKQVNSDIEIMWEDCGTFPFNYSVPINSEKDFNDTKDLIKKLISLREKGVSTFVYKGCAIIDWLQFYHQQGPFVFGNNSNELKENDTKYRLSHWKVLQGQWLKYGHYAQEMTEMIYEESKGKSAISLCGNFDDGIWIPEALTAMMLWDSSLKFDDMSQKVFSRNKIRLA